MSQIANGPHFEAFYVPWISLEDKYYLQKVGQDLCRRPDSEVNYFVQGQDFLHMFKRRILLKPQKRASPRDG